MNLNHFDTVLSDATPEEIQLWERVYIKVSQEDVPSGIPRSLATQAVLNRREVFPHTRQEEDEDKDTL